jgi:hypothetical protein
MLADPWRLSMGRSWQKRRESALHAARRRTLTDSALFVEPKWAQYLQSSGVTEAMGKPIALPTKAEREKGAFERIV